MTYGVTSTGFVLKPLPVILQELTERQRSDIDPEWNTDADSLAGQYNGIFGDQIAQLWEVLEAVSNTLNRDGAVGASLDIIGALVGTRREPASKSTVLLTMDLNAGTEVAAGAVVSVADNPAIRVITREPAINSAGVKANVTVQADAENAGAITALAGSLTVIETPVAGWNSVTNAAPLIGGADIESDAAYYTRQLNELAAAGGGTLAGLRADLLAVSGVEGALVLENETAVTVDGIPPHAFEAIVYMHIGTDPATIAGVIWASKPAGIMPHGLEPPIVITDEDGYEHTVRFSRPTVRPVYVAIEVGTTPLYPGPDAVQKAIANACIDANSPAYLGIGIDVYGGRLVQIAMGVPGVVQARVGLDWSQITSLDGDYSDYLVIDTREIASLPTGNIAVSSWPT